MNFQIQALPMNAFKPLFDLSDDELAARQIRRLRVESCPGAPCRVSMRDAEVGETVLLLNYQHQSADSPYMASHAIFVRKDAQRATFAVNEVPEVIRSRLVSLRYFDEDHMMIDADVVAGDDAATALSQAFENPQISYAHIHNAKPGCFAASVHRAA